MKTVTVRELQQSVKDCVDISQSESVVVTRHGKPTAIIVGIAGQDWEDVVVETSQAFWKLIRRRRREKPVSMAAMRKRLGLRQP